MPFKTMLLRLTADISAVHDKTFYCFRFSSLFYMSLWRNYRRYTLGRDT